MKTYSAKPTDVTRKWYILDASEVTLGRLSTRVASLLLGKRKPQFTAHIDCGDYVIVVNAKDLKTTGGKETKKSYYTHSGYPSGLTERSLQEQLTLDPTRIIFNAVYGMLPDNKLRTGRMNRLKIYTGVEHGHEAQKPETVSIKDLK